MYATNGPRDAVRKWPNNPPPRRPLVSPMRHSSHTKADNTTQHDGVIGLSRQRWVKSDKSLHSNVYGL